LRITPVLYIHKYYNIGEAKDNNIGFLVVGDPLCATTHIDLILRAKKFNIIIEIIHNTSVMGACASCGLPLYQYGYTVSIPYFEENWKPDSFYSRIKYNLYGDMHTLCLLDIKVKEPNYESMMKYGKLVYMPPRFMTVSKLIVIYFIFIISTIIIIINEIMIINHVYNVYIL